MQRLCDEVIQIIFYDLDDPGPLSHVNKRLYHFSQDPYVRAHYFLTHYGPMEAMFQALGHGGVLTERVLDILLSSGAHISRYLVQVAMHHYFHTASHFIKTSWVRNVPFGVFTHFLKVAEGMYGDIPRAKNEDDGYIFHTFLKESRWPSTSKTVTWETIREILEKYNFIPFSNRDPLMVQFPLALAVEPQLLPYAVKNGFFMDLKYLNFVFRKMFERTGASNDTTVEEIVHNVRELCRLDHTMFVSRTVAAEVCMEAKSNVAGYRALKALDKSRDLRFELADVVEELIKTFVRTRSICSPETIETLRLLYADYPSSDHTARLVMFVIFFNTESMATPSAMHTRLEALGLTPLTKKDVFNILLNPFINNANLVMDYATVEVVKSDGRKGMSIKELKAFLEDVISKCLELSCKGRLLEYLKKRYMFVEDLIKHAVQQHRLTLEDLPLRLHDNGEPYRPFEAKLSRDHTGFCFLWRRQEQLWIEYEDGNDEDKGRESPADEVNDTDGRNADPSVSKWGFITQETLSTMIKRDEVMPVRSRRRIQSPGPSLSESTGKLPYPSDTVTVGQWIRKTYGSRSLPTAVFMTHAVINNNYNILETYLPTNNGYRHTIPGDRVPITLHHFKLLARLGQRPSDSLYCEILKGCEFFFDEDDYLKHSESSPVKTESSPVSSPRKTRPRSETSSSASSSNGRRRKRPRRSATAITSYVVPGSDDEDLSNDEVEVQRLRLQESSILKWIDHLGELLKEEQRKVREKKRKLRSALEPGAKPRIYKTEFHKSLATHLRDIRSSEEAKKAALYELADVQVDYSDDDDDEYLQTKTKRRKAGAQ